MARVNHKLVKQRLNEKRSKITDKQFFSSRMLAGHFEDLAAAQTRRYHYNRRVRVNLYWKPKDAFTAATDNMQIRINTGHPLVTKVKGRENRYQLVCGMFAHELGHVLFTDFLSAQTYHNYLDSFKWYPRPPAFRLAADARNEKAFWEYVKEDPKNLQMVHQIAANIANIIEDGYIENRMLNSFPGTLGYGLETLRERHFDEIDTVTELIAKETDDGRHYSYAEFNGFDNDDKYRLMDISARGSNRDGAALRYVAEALSKRSETVKLLILVSDGQPADTGYYGTAAEEDLRGIKQEYQRKGILFVAAAIGNDKQNIERIYGDSFLDITDLNQLPTKLTGVVKRHIRV